MGFANSIRITLAKEQSIATGLLGFNIGLELGQIVVVLAVLIILFLLTSIFKMDRKNWIMFVSSGVFALSLQMALERVPFKDSILIKQILNNSVKSSFLFAENTPAILYL